MQMDKQGNLLTVLLQMNSVADNPLELFLRAEAATENLLPKVAILHQQKKIATGDR